jgi:hypothetical protein
MLELLRAQGPRGAVFAAWARRSRAFGTSDADAEALLAALRAGVARDETAQLSAALTGMRSELLAPALLAVVKDDASAAEQRAVAYRVLWEQAATLGVADAVVAMRGAEALFVARLDRGDRDMHLAWILRWLHTPGCRRALERAAAAEPQGRRTDVTRALEGW